MKRVLLMMFAICTLSSCDKEKDEPKNIEVTGGSVKQELFADNTQGEEGVKFTTTGAWTSTITPATKADAPTWVSIDPASGDKAGEYAINIKLEANYTGEVRKAEIKINCSGTIITITVEQKATTKDGEIPKPEPEPSGAGILTNETSKQSCKLVGATHEISRHNVVRVVFEGEGEEKEGKVEKHDFMADFYNPLQNGRLQSGVYKIKNFNGSSDSPKDGECDWIKSILGDYGNSGTVKVELNGGVYSFTIDIQIGSGSELQNLKGSFVGVPRYMNEEIKVESITLNEGKHTLELGHEIALVATILPENATNQNYIWSSGNTAVITVSEDGLVQGVGAGKATITATTVDGNKTAACEITVNSAVAVQSIKVEPTEISLLEGEAYTGAITVTVSPENAYNKNYTWKSSNANIAEYTGKVIEAKAAGEATITFTTEDGAKTATLKVTVTERTSHGNGKLTFVDKSGKGEDEVLSLIELKHTVLSKNSVQLVFVDSQGKNESRINLYNPLSNGSLAAGSYMCVYPASSANNTFSSEYLGQYGYYNKGSVTVAIDGDTYTVTMNNVETTNNYSVTGSYSGKLTHTNEYVDVHSVNLNHNILTLTLGDSYLDLEATVMPENAFNKNVGWSSSNSDVVYVNEAGELKTNKAGTATITVTTEDGANTATCVVTVNPIPSTGDGTFSSTNGQSIHIKRATQWVNEKDPKNVEFTFYKDNSTNPSMLLTIIRGAGDTGALKAGTYTSIYNLNADELGIKYSYNVTGTVTVALSGEQYTVTVNVTSPQDGVTVTGTYSGKM